MHTMIVTFCVENVFVLVQAAPSGNILRVEHNPHEPKTTDTFVLKIVHLVAAENLENILSNTLPLIFSMTILGRKVWQSNKSPGDMHLLQPIRFTTLQ